MKKKPHNIKSNDIYMTRTMEHVSQCISNKLYANMMLIKIMGTFLSIEYHECLPIVTAAAAAGCDCGFISQLL